MAVITEAYRALQQELYATTNYGVASLELAPLVKATMAEFGARSLSDYGAGRQNLCKALQAAGLSFEYHPYDPAFPEYGEARPADLVACIDVLEHVEPECLRDVLDDLKRITTTRGLFSVHTGPAMKTLSDGRNAHLNQQAPDWWRSELGAYFSVKRMKVTGETVVFLVEPG